MMLCYAEDVGSLQVLLALLPIMHLDSCHQRTTFTASTRTANTRKRAPIDAEWILPTCLMRQKKEDVYILLCCCEYVLSLQLLLAILTS
jgi:hypothetical protein